VKRREFITLLGSAAAWPLAVRAQQSERPQRVGVLIGVGDDAQGQARLAAFRQGMQDLGWSEGRNIRFDIRFSEGDTGRARAYAAELLAVGPNAILANTASVVSALQQQTRTIPIVFVQVLDPVSSGFVESLARPGGNITGFSGFDFGLGAKWLELLKDVAPTRDARGGPFRFQLSHRVRSDGRNPVGGAVIGGRDKPDQLPRRDRHRAGGRRRLRGDRTTV
jgi:ABC-type uncharacterized transport system substrate-binding protein